MKSILTSLTILILAITVNAQNNDTLFYNTGKFYPSAEGEMIFSFGDVSSPDGVNFQNNLRWSPVLNIAGHLNYDVSRSFGLNIGLAMRNVGFIIKYDGDEMLFDPEHNIDRVKFRTYNLGIPIGFKIGKLHQEKPFFLFAGYEFELPFHFKQKEFDGSDKENKDTDWFSDRTAPTMHALFAGIQLPGGASVKFKYYLTEFFDPDFTENINGILVKPYEEFNANVFYFSLEFFPFQDTKRY